MKERRLFLDFLRVVAILLVIYNHTGREGYMYFVGILDTPARFPVMAAGSVCRIAVPLFFMASGATLLQKEESLRVLYRRRVLRFVLVLVLFSLVSYIWECRSTGGFSVTVFLRELLLYMHVHTYWFLYQYLAYLICLPFLRHMARGMTNQQFQYLALVMLGAKVLELVPLYVFRFPESYSPSFALFSIETAVFYPLMGYYLGTHLPDTAFTRKKAGIAALFFAGAVCVMVFTQNFYANRFDGWNVVSGEAYLSTLVFIPACALFLQARLLFLRHCPGRGLTRALLLFSECSFGVYLLHHIWMDLSAPVHAFLQAHCGVYPGTLLWVCFLLPAGTAVTWVLKKLPLLRKLL